MPKLKTPTAEPKTAGDLKGSNTRAMLYGYVERYERLQEEKEALAEDQKEIMGEAKGTGFDTAILRRVIARRKAPRADVLETDMMVETYEESIAAEEKRLLAENLASAPAAPTPEQVKKGWGGSTQAPPAPAPEPVQADIEDEDEDHDPPAAGDMPAFLRREA